MDTECGICGEAATKMVAKHGAVCDECHEAIENGDIESDLDDEDEFLCLACNGSGEGDFSGSTCYPCMGSGIEGRRRQREEDKEMAAEMRFDEERDERMLRGEK